MTANPLLDVLEASWPASEYAQAGPFRIGRGLGAGRRVSAAIATAESWTEDHIAQAVGIQAGWDQQPLFRADPESSLAIHLRAQGWRPDALTLVMTAPVDALTDQEVPPITCFPIWPPMAIQRDIWTERGINAARQAVMGRVKLPKTSLLGRTDDRAAATAFLAADRSYAVLHALEVLPDRRRRGLAKLMLREAAFWAEAQGCDTLALAVTAENAAAIALYEGVGFSRVGRYEYYLG